MELVETKQILAVLLLLACGSVALCVTLLFDRMRDAALLALSLGAVWAEKLSVTFAGTFWYRGTSRGIEISALDILPLCLLTAALCVPRHRRERWFWPAGLGLMLVYAAYCAVSVLLAEPRIHGAWELVKMLRGLLVFVAVALFVRTPRELAIVVIGFCGAAWIEVVAAFDQRFLSGIFRAKGTFDHENTLSTFLCTIAPVLIAAAMSRWNASLRWFAGLSWVAALGAEMLTLSRLGIPVFLAASAGTALVCSAWRLTRQKVVIGCATAAVLGVFAYFSWDGLAARYGQSNLTAELTDERAFETRGVYWRLATRMIADHPLGVGLNNWSYYVAKRYGRELGHPYHDYDEFVWGPTPEEAATKPLPPAADTLPVLTLGELGIAGFLVFSAVWLRWFHLGAGFLRDRLNDDPMHRVAIGCLFGILGIFGQSATEWTYRQPPVLFICHTVVGALAGMVWARTRREIIQASVATPRPKLAPELLWLPRPMH